MYIGKLMKVPVQWYKVYVDFEEKMVQIFTESVRNFQHNPSENISVMVKMFVYLFLASLFIKLKRSGLCEFIRKWLKLIEKKKFKGQLKIRWGKKVIPTCTFSLPYQRRSQVLLHFYSSIMEMIYKLKGNLVELKEKKYIETSVLFIYSRKGKVFL